MDISPIHMERDQIFGCLRYSPFGSQLSLEKIYLDIIQVYIFEFNSQVCISSLQGSGEVRHSSRGFMEKFILYSFLLIILNLKYLLFTMVIASLSSAFDLCGNQEFGRCFGRLRTTEF